MRDYKCSETSAKINLKGVFLKTFVRFIYEYKF